MQLQTVPDEDIARLAALEPSTAAPSGTERPVAVVKVAASPAQHTALCLASVEYDRVFGAPVPVVATPPPHGLVDEAILACTGYPRARPPAAAEPSAGTAAAECWRDVPPARLRRLIAHRRSAGAFDPGAPAMEWEAFVKTMRRAYSAGKCRVLPGRPRVNLLVYVHRVERLEPGLYLLPRCESHLESLRAQFATAFPAPWVRVPLIPHGDIPFYRLKAGDMTYLARALSCEQAIASDGHFAVSFVAQWASFLGTVGPVAYRLVHWEAGLIGQHLYLAAEDVGLRGNGVGCFFGGLAARWLALPPEGEWVDVYHFAVGKQAVGRERPLVQGQGAYGHLAGLRAQSGLDRDGVATAGF